MEYARQQRDPTRHVIGIAFVVLFHALIIWALITGLGKQMVEVIKKPLSATIIEEIKAPPPPPPPPPPKKIVEPPKVQVQQPYVPPPDIPPPVAPSDPVIANVAPTPPPEPVVIAPPPVIAPPAPPKPAIRQGVSCQTMEKPSFPREASNARISDSENGFAANSLNASRATSTAAPGSVNARPKPAAAHSAVTAGLRHAGRVAGAGRSAITFAVNPASSM